MFHSHIDPDPPTLILQGDLTIEHAQDIHAQMVASLPREGTLTVTLAADEVDSSLLQLLAALAREARQRGLGLRVRDSGQVQAFCLRVGGKVLWQTLGAEVVT